MQKTNKLHKSRAHLKIVMKLTVDLINQSPQYRNAAKERELYLRGYRITVIENMGATLVNQINDI